MLVYGSERFLVRFAVKATQLQVTVGPLNLLASARFSSPTFAVLLLFTLSLLMRFAKYVHLFFALDLFAFTCV